MILYGIFIRFSHCFFISFFAIYSHQRKLNPVEANTAEEEKKLMLFYFFYFVFRLSPSRFLCQLNGEH